MIVQKEGEPRIHYLARVLYWMMENTHAGEATADYDETNCDGLCLAYDFIYELGICEDELESEQ